MFIACFFSYAKLSYETEDHRFALENTLLIEGFGSKNLNLLNDENRTGQGKSLDRIIIPGQHTWDIKFSYAYGKDSYERDVFSSRVGLRNKGVWGAPESIASTKNADVKLTNVTTGSHKHDIPVHPVTVRELWMSMDIAALTGGCTNTYQTFSVGLFPYQLGRGIALGPAYQVVPDLIGYKPIDSVQQFTPGFLFSGSVFPDYGLRYDIYGAILENKSDNFARINEKNRGQEIGKLNDPARGSGVINYIVAARLPWTPINEEQRYAYIEPYGLYNRQEEQKVEFVGDATMSLGTIGCAAELQAGDFEFGFDTAFNAGQQHVKAWDRNQITFQRDNTGNTRGFPRAVNSEVRNPNAGNKRIYVPGQPQQDKIYEQAIRATQISDVARLNGRTFDRGQSRNSNNRFRNAYVNDLEGSMFVCDAAYRLNSCIKLAITGGFSSGDENPNRDLNQRGESEQDGTFGGFLGLQEIYSGKRVKSYMVMSGFGRFPRVASFPDANRGDQFGNTFADRVSRFADLQFVGTAAWIDTNTDGKWRINPNLLSFWKHNTTRIFNPQTDQRGEIAAHDHLGIECNVAIHGYPLKDVKFFAIGGVFGPGAHYNDIQGRPINKDQARFLDRPDRTGFDRDPVPLLGNDVGWFINTGFECRF